MQLNFVITRIDTPVSHHLKRAPVNDWPRKAPSDPRDPLKNPLPRPEIYTGILFGNILIRANADVPV